jgi:hypothetical protein
LHVREIKYSRESEKPTPFRKKKKNAELGLGVPGVCRTMTQNERGKREKAIMDLSVIAFGVGEPTTRPNNIYQMGDL